MIANIPAWLQALVDQRMALINSHLAEYAGYTMILTPLTEPGEDTKVALDYWDRCCDNCGTYCPPESEYYTGHLVENLKDGRPVYMTYGVCPSCKETFTLKA